MSQDNNRVLATRTLKDVYAVSRLVREARATLEGSFPLVWVEGEVSNLAMPASGHIYFTLKDEVAQVRCAMFRNRNRQLRFTPENGMQVLMRVRVTLYEGRGEFQLVVEHMEQAGSGALQRAYEALKQRLGQEGLFDQTLKQALPAYPQTIGIVSSPDGAAVHDILSVLQRRFTSVNIILYPVAVQGDGAMDQIRNAIDLANQRQECDVLIVGRGGGSLEDLWSFNDEKVARAIAASTIPIISAVGHEIDFTIADFVADVRAPTPSAAAELAVPDQAEILNKLAGLQQRLSTTLKDALRLKQQRVLHLLKRLPKPSLQLAYQQKHLTQLRQQLSLSQQRLLQNKQQALDLVAMRIKHPQAKIDLQQQKLGALSLRLQQLMQDRMQRSADRQRTVFQRLNSVSPLPVIEQQQQKLQSQNELLHRVIQQKLETKKQYLAQQMRTLAAVSPLSTLERGYSITSDAETGHVLQSSDGVEVGKRIHVKLHQGQLECEVSKVKHD
jgi:exodeoxyribonuclease VII large subunit